MGRVGDGGEVKTYIGISEADAGIGAKLSEAFESAAGELMRDKIIGPDSPDPDGTVWLQVTLLEVELGNQHPRTVKVGVTLKDPPPS